MLGLTKKKSTGLPQAPKSEQSSLALQIVNRYLRWILFLVISVVLFAGYTFILQIQIREAQSAARESLPAKLKVLDDLKSIKIKLDEAILDYERIKAQKKPALDRIALLLPRHSQYGDLFSLLNAVTEASGMKLQTMSLSLPADVQPAVTTNTEGVSPTDPVAGGLVRPMSIQINVEGGDYEGLKKYLENLERNIRLFDVTSVAVNGSVFVQQENGVTTTPRYDIQLTTYYQP